MPRAAAPASAAVPRPGIAEAQDAERATTGSSAERTLRLLGIVAREGRPMALAELTQRLGLPKVTAHRICLNLLEGGFLVRDVDERSFSVGPALRDLAFATLNHGVARGLRHQILAALVAEIGETCNFTTQDGAEVLYLDRVEAKWPLRLSLDVGSHVPLHCTASGKLFLASLPAADRDQILGRLTLDRRTPATITTARALREECARIAACGYSCDREEFITGLIAVAVPIVAADGRTRAAVAVHAPSTRMALDRALTKLPALRAAAARLGELL